MDMDDAAPLSPSSSAPGPIHPPSALDSLSPVQLSQLQTELSTELYGFAPLSFTSRIVDLANDVIYDVVDKVEIEVLKRWSGNVASASGSASDANANANEQRKDKVMKGVNRLETLLMAAVDLRFDQAEVYLLRNTFRTPVNLIPHILLPHHPPEGFAPYTASSTSSAEGQQVEEEKEDDLLMKDLEEEIREANLLREEVMLLGTVQERLDRRLEALKRVKSGLSELLTQGGARDTLSEHSKNIALTLPLYISQCKSLLSSSSFSSTPPNNHITTTEEGGEEAWKKSREAYLSWRTERAQNGSGSDSVGGKEGREDEGMRNLNKELGNSGGQRDLKALKDLIAA